MLDTVTLPCQPEPVCSTRGMRFARPRTGAFVDLDRLGDVPRLLVVIDTEEEFDWAAPLSRNNRAVTSIAAQDRAQEVFGRHNIVPTYVVDWPVASDDSAVAVLKRHLDADTCLIGTHLHPWVNPPDEEVVNPVNSYPGNLPEALERAKLQRLTDLIARNFGSQPVIYKAGRYGVGRATPQLLAELGYCIDMSVVPRTSFAEDGGPDFTDLSDTPYWIDVGPGTVPLLEIPLSTGFAGCLAGHGAWLFPRLDNPLGRALRIKSILARTRMMERIRLSPEGVDVAAHCRLTRALLAQGSRVFMLTYHSPSLAPGHTPYVRNEADVRSFLDSLDRYATWFTTEIGGKPATPLELYALFSGSSDKRPA